MLLDSKGGNPQPRIESRDESLARGRRRWRCCLVFIHERFGNQIASSPHSLSLVQALDDEDEGNVVFASTFHSPRLGVI